MEPPPSPRPNPILPLLAAAGILWWVVEAWLDAFPWYDGAGYSVAAAAILLVAVFAAVALFFRRGGVALIREPLLLLPFGVLVLARHVLGLTLLVPFIVAATSFSLLSISIELSLYFIVALLLEVGYAAWMTRLLLDREEHGKGNAQEALRSWKRDFLRAAIFMVVGQVGILLPAGLVLTAVGGKAAVWLMPIWGLFWNCLTVAFLPMALRAPTVGAGFAGAFRAARIPGLWVVVLVHQVLIGIVVYLSVSDTTVTTETTRRPGHTQTSTHRDNWTRTGTYTTAVWTGGYESDFRWHDKLMANIVRVPGWPPVELLLGILAAALAIVVKIEVIRRLPPGSDSV